MASRMSLARMFSTPARSARHVLRRRGWRGSRPRPMPHLGKTPFTWKPRTAKTCPPKTPPFATGQATGAASRISNGNNSTLRLEFTEIATIVAGMNLPTESTLIQLLKDWQDLAIAVFTGLCWLISYFVRFAEDQSKKANCLILSKPRRFNT